MGSIQEGGVHTQKVSAALGIIALLLMGAFVCCSFASDADDATVTINVEAESDFCGVSKTVKYTLSGDGSYYYRAELLNSDGVSSGTVTGKTGYLTGVPYESTVTVTAPATSGNYSLSVKFYNNSSEDAEVLAEKNVPLKVVDPITLKFTLENVGDTDVVFTAYFKINGEKAEDSVQTVTVPANGTKDVTFDYFVRDVKDTTYSLCTDDAIVNDAVSGLNEEKKFYANDTDYTVITTLVVIVLVIMVVILFFIMRKPVVNKGKPKGRR